MTGTTKHERRMLAWYQSRPAIAAYYRRPDAYMRAVRRWEARKP